MSQKDIIIIGAGLAGLAAARELQKNQCKVTILEARNRIGGRICTKYDESFLFEEGAILIHGTENNPIAKLADQLGQKYLSVDISNILFCNPHPLKQAFPSYIDDFSNLMYQAKKFADQQAQDCSLRYAIEKLESINPSVDKDWLKWRLAASTLYFGIEPEFVSARNWDIEEELRGGNHVLLQGYQPIVDYLASGLDIKLNTVVTKINWSDKKIKIKTSALMDYEADLVLITLPLGVLQEKQDLFVPLLPKIKLQAIHDLRMGVLNKIALKFPKPFWPTEFLHFAVMQNEAIPSIVHFPSIFKANVLIAASGGEHAKAIEKLSDAETVELILSEVKNMFGNDIPVPQEVRITRWIKDPFARGAYCYLSVGGNPNSYRELGQPIENKLFFAGEATHEKHPTTTHGAYLSGVREAERILQQD